MKSLGLHDIIGPIMVGPSSSHTAGALRIAHMVRNLLGAEPVEARFTLYGSFSHTYKGHGTDKALVAGMLGFFTNDLRIRDSFALAKEQGLYFSIVPDSKTETAHPNTVDIVAKGADGSQVTARGVSIGGGAAELTRIDGIDVHVTGEFNSLIVRQLDSPGVLAHITYTMSKRGVNIGTVTMHRKQRGGEAFTVLEIDDRVPQEAFDEVLENENIEEIRFIPADSPSADVDGGALHASPAEEDLHALQRDDFKNAAELLARCTENNCSLGAVFAKREQSLLRTMGCDPSIQQNYLAQLLEVMRTSATEPTENPVASMGGLIGGESARLKSFYRAGAKGENGRRSLLGSLHARCTAYALAVLETNASMGCIVAAPTAGSAGVIPAVLFSLADEYGIPDDGLEAAVLTAAAVGYIISKNATVSGAEGGCQAEIGAASAMAAAAATELMGGDAACCLDAAAIALGNMLGLACDPIGGLVEAPCQMRNASAASNSLVAAELALSGTKSLVPFDEVVEAMLQVGRSLPKELRETALGGMAACPSCAKFEISYEG